MTIQKCAACHRKALQGTKYCMHHDQAFHRLMEHHKAWVTAYGGISMDDFMNKILGMEETGSWIKEVIEIEMKNS
jgi:hypothetical protein